MNGLNQVQETKELMKQLGYAAEEAHQMASEAHRDPEHEDYILEQAQGYLDCFAENVAHEGNPTLPSLNELNKRAKELSFNTKKLEEVLAYGEVYWSEEL